jgi:hypothetical protein
MLLTHISNKGDSLQGPTGYIYILFGLEASDPGPGSRLANKDHCPNSSGPTFNLVYVARSRQVCYCYLSTPENRQILITSLTVILHGRQVYTAPGESA